MGNNTATATATAGTFPVFALASLVMMVLKLGGVGGFATLSWWWVFAPVLIGFGLFVLILVVILIIAIFFAAFS